MISIQPILAAAETSGNELPKLPDSPYFWVPPDASVTTGNIDALYNFLMWTSSICTIGIMIAIVLFLKRYKAKSRKANEQARSNIDHNTALEVTWSIIPLVIVIIVFIAGFKGFVDLRTPPKDSMEIHATGQKWKWTFTYPGGLVDDTLHVPLNKSVRIVIESTDVLHSLYIPAFRTKMDAVPGRYTDLWFRATQTGEFPIFCAEYCGLSHSNMLTHIEVHPDGGYEEWMRKQIAIIENVPPVELGQLRYKQQGCGTCHSLDGTPGIGPSWKGIFGKSEQFTDGSSTIVDENYIKDSIMNPQAKIVQGFAPAMPTYQGKLSDRDVTGIIEFIKTLK